jgi:hypothetical protein
MIAQGLRVLRFTNEQVFNDVENVILEIAKYLPSYRKTKASLPSPFRIRAGETSGWSARDTSPLPNPLPKGEGDMNQIQFVASVMRGRIVSRQRCIGKLVLVLRVPVILGNRETNTS